MSKNKKEEEKKEEIVEEEEEEEKVLEPEFVYPENHVFREEDDTPIPQKCIRYFQNFGFDSSKRYNLHLMDENTILYISGAAFFLVNIETKKKEIFFSKDGAGIGAIAVHPTKKYFAVAEKGNYPNIYVYEYPSLRVKRLLKRGTERSYSHVNFSANGEKLASVGSAPDYLICIWDWMQEKITLKAKAFSQEVYSVAFSKYDEDILTTSGMGHIKFWKIAQTFTGLKLKGEIAKFGQVELSDVTAYYIFPDEKVLSGTEYGKLLLWEGNMIKAVLSIDEETPCHKGAIESIFLEGDHIITAGEDGTIKMWNFNEMNECEGDDHLNYFMKPSGNFQLSSDNGPSKILTIERGEKFWLVFDKTGFIWKINIPDLETQEIEKEVVMETNSGKLMDLAVSNRVNAAVTIGEDGAVRLWDYVKQREMYNRIFKGSGTCLEWVPQNDSNKGRVLLAGFDDGVVRVLLLNKNGFVLIRAVRVHRNPIYKLKISPSGTILAVATRKGEVFFLEMDHSKPQNFEPYCLLDLGFQINDMSWHEDSSKLLFACEDGKVREMRIPQKYECDTSESYHKDTSFIDFKSYTIKMMEFQKPKLDEYEEFMLARKDPRLIKEKLEEEWDPAPVLACSYLDTEGSKFVCSAADKYLGYFYICNFDEDRPVQEIKVTPHPYRFFKFFDSYTILLGGHDNGSFVFKRKENWEPYLAKACHDRDYGRVRKVELSYDHKLILTASEDGTMCTFQVDNEAIHHAAIGSTDITPLHPEISLDIPDWFFDEAIELNEDVEVDITDDVYSIQEDKLNTEEDNKKSQADRKKQKILGQIKQLQARYLEIKQKNAGRDENFRLTEDEMLIDPEYDNILRGRVSDLLEETKKELAWDLAFHELKAKKLKDYFVDELYCARFRLKAFKTQNSVTTFKVKKLSEYAERELLEINRILDEEFKNQIEEGGKDGVDGDGEKGGDFKFKKGGLGLKSRTDEASKGLKGKLAERKRLMQRPGAKKDQEKKTYEKYDREKAKKEAEERQQELAELEKRRPNKEDFKPEIAEEITRFGDKKLKSSPDFVVPDEQRMNVSKKRKHMFLLYEILYNSKREFNDKVLGLRDRKKEIIEKVKKYNTRLQEIDKQLEIETTYYIPTLDEKLEEPEKFFDVKDAEVDEYAKKKEEERLAAQAKAQMFGGGGPGGQAQAEEEKKAADKKGPSASYQAAQKAEQDKGKAPVIQTKDRKNKKASPSELDAEVKLATEMRLKSEKQELLDEIENDISQFDTDVMRLQLDKAFLESNMKVVDMKFVTHYQELVILTEMEEHDQKLHETLMAAREEENNLKNQSAKKMGELNINASDSIEVEKQLGEVKGKYQAHFHEDLTKAEKLFLHYQRDHRKRMERQAKKEGDDDGSGDEDDDDDDPAFEEEDEDDKVDIAPIESDQDLRKLVDKRIELEEKKITLQTTKDALNTEMRSLKKRLEKISEQIRTTELALRDYQRDKLQRINRLFVSHFLELSQIQNLIPKKDGQGNEFLEMPSELHNSILFTEEELTRLHLRRGELEEETKEIKNKKSRAEAAKKQLNKVVDRLKKEKNDADKAHEEEHMLRFGDVMNLEVLDSLVPTQEVLRKREEFKKEERECEKKVEESRLKFLAAKKTLLEEKKENTRILRKITKLGEEQMRLNKNLDSTNKGLFKDDGGDDDRKSNLTKEKGHLIELVKFLAKEIEDLKTEIGLFKKKGGHIYTMVTSNKKTLEDMN